MADAIIAGLGAAVGTFILGLWVGWVAHHRLGVFSAVVGLVVFACCVFVASASKPVPHRSSSYSGSGPRTAPPKPSFSQQAGDAAGTASRAVFDAFVGFVDGVTGGGEPPPPKRRSRD